MRRAFSWAAVAAAALALAVAMLLLGGLRPVSSPAQDLPPQGRAVPPAAGEISSRQNATDTISSLQTRLRRLPEDWSAWSALGAAYVQQARLSADPGYYSRAEEAFARSLSIRPADNADALTGQGALAASRHEFAEALRLARAAQRINPYSAANQGVLVDALIELGRYDEADKQLQRMVDLKPGVPSLARVSYARELRGELAGARQALDRTLALASQPSDAAFAAHLLGELAFKTGDLDRAASAYEDALRRDPAYLPAVAGRAAVTATRGDTEAALREYDALVRRLPDPAYLTAYGELLESVGRHDEARRQYDLVDTARRLAQAQGANVDLELALFDADHGRPQEALRAAEAEAKRRASVYVADAYAWALHVNGRDREALAQAEAAARLGTREASFAYHRGMIEKSLGMDDAARASLQRALDTNPHFSVLHAPRARAALAELGSGS